MLKDIFGSVFSQKILKKDSNVSKVKKEKDNLEIEASLKIITKLSLSFKTLAQEFKKISLMDFVLKAVDRITDCLKREYG